MVMVRPLTLPFKKRAYLFVRDALGRALAAVLLVVLSPLMLGLALWIRKDSPGPALFFQKRIGYKGQVFTVYKFRTMRYDQSRQQYKVNTAKGDFRITQVGSLLRRYKLDELPQLINILRGEMSFIGPRPEMLFSSRRFARYFSPYARQFVVRPGITGMGQVFFGYSTTYEETHRKLRYDLYYVRHVSLCLDLVITWKTLTFILKGFER